MSRDSEMFSKACAIASDVASSGLLPDDDHVLVGLVTAVLAVEHHRLTTVGGRAGFLEYMRATWDALEAQPPSTDGGS